MCKFYCREILLSLRRLLKIVPGLRVRWPSTEWETGLTQKSGENGKKNGNGPRPEMASEMEKWLQKWDFGHFFSIFSISVAIFRPCQAGGHFPSFFPIFPGFLRQTGFPFCRWPPHTKIVPGISSENLLSLLGDRPSLESIVVYRGQLYRSFQACSSCRTKPKGDGGKGTGKKMSRQFAKKNVTTICDKRHDNLRHFMTISVSCSIDIKRHKTS